MNISWNDQYDQSEIAQRIENTRKVDSSGNVTFAGTSFELITNRVVLHSMLKFPDSLPEIETRRIVEQAITNAGQKGHITTKSLLAEANRLAASYLKCPLERYVLVTSLSVRSSDSFRQVRINGAVIILNRHLPYRYQGERVKIAPAARNFLLADVPDDYFPVRVHVSARSVYEAADSALNTLDLVRGAWNWFFNRAVFLSTSSGVRVPINKIVLGPVHTLHHLNGKLATETWWYEPLYYGSLSFYGPSDNFDGMYRFLSSVREKLAKSSYRQRIEEAITRYARALDERDWEAVFLKLWGVLELLTGTDRGYDTTIRRASFVFEDRNYYRQVLRHLKDYRNRFVHDDASSSVIETYIYQLKGVVEALLEFHLGEHFASFCEACRFLHLPSGRNELQSRIKMLRHAQRFFQHV
jgi:hypothetical protein